MSQRGSEAEVRQFYERHPYPALGTRLKRHWDDFPMVTEALANEASVHYLDAGCGSGNGTVGVAKRFPAWRCTGVDLSHASLHQAQEVARHHGVGVEWVQASLSADLAFLGQFDVITCYGVLHHCESAKLALGNLVKILAPSGYFVGHVYSRRQDEGKMRLRCALDLVVPDLADTDRRFCAYQLIRERQRSILDLTLRQLARSIRRSTQNALFALRGLAAVPKWSESYSSPDARWRDHFSHPLESWWDVPSVRTLTETAGLDVQGMPGLDDVDLSWLPGELSDSLDKWSRWELSELLSPAPSALLFIARRSGAMS